ncbi:glucosamine-6-phosphate deaminase [Cerasicoccus arenae]|uniref:Glucosamine-6-phosphate deaminase n=1 Tax=Cerasicoccus arenae TaxID=424488 RepID=A0A8J3D9L2_9BACT|nr:glucosamine-6-phosphate deaminase [Cerasicoccus arenae]MBK1857058.1 glucosamine-6-phosphate deaminase [Cerasicoccus arenae]GHB92119.1 glucosamine-6-phosphate deaminase [Cerasicoccus arenae]
MKNGAPSYTQREVITTQIYPSADQACTYVADAITDLVSERNAAGQPTVLGLATGSTPVRLYRELIRRCQAGLSFQRVITFNLDEYYGLSGDHPESYRRFMQDQLFDHIDILPENTHVPDGLAAKDEVFESCSDYEAAMREAGGLDIQILGIGRTGHIGFNEPGSGPESRTRLVTLDSLTRRDAARDFLGEENVPRHAITMGVGTILDARQIFLLAWGEAKARVIAESVEAPPSESIPASFLQGHPNCVFCVDEAAASHLTRLRYPWLVGPVDWTETMTRKAVVWLAQKSNKPLLRLTDEDYTENAMADLLTEKGSAYDLNIRIFNTTQHTITGWPGGKPDADDSYRPERRIPFPKRSLVLSSEPTDDVFCMGGVLHRLANQKHQLTVAYLTSGNLAVPDTDVRRSIELIIELGERLDDVAEVHFARKVEQQLDAKGQFGEDSSDLRRLKGLIRRGEARSSARLLGIDPAQLRFLDLPFYETGRYRRFQITKADVAAMVTLLNEIRPHQIFATGHGHDPLSVPALSFEVLQIALRACAGADWLKDCWIWLYRGPGVEWEIHEMDMAVPLSPDELDFKIKGIYQHQTQRSQSPGGSKQDANSWNLASALNRATAQAYDALGLAEYEAIEGFKRFRS